jgi:hypothetical protein
MSALVRKGIHASHGHILVVTIEMILAGFSVVFLDRHVHVATPSTGALLLDVFSDVLKCLGALVELLLVLLGGVFHGYSPSLVGESDVK